MPLRINHVIEGGREIVVPFGGDAITLTYNPQNLSLGTSLKLTEAAGDSGNIFFRDVPLFFSELFSAWDMEDEDGAPLPLNEANIRRLPTALIQAILEVWQEDTTIPNAPSTGSRSGSSTRTPRAISARKAS